MADAATDRCVLDHRAFTMLGTIMFRRAIADGAAVMVIQLGAHEVTVPLRALQNELGIPDDSADGQMLSLIAESLDYVSGLSLGDKLPNEVVNGNASWLPEPRHRAIATARLRLQLISWLSPDSPAADTDADAILHRDSDPDAQAQVQVAFEQAAQTLGLAGPDDVGSVLGELARELSYIEALRETLLVQVRSLTVRLSIMGQNRSFDLKRLETLRQVERLSVIGVRQISMRFLEVDAQTGEVISALRNADAQGHFIRTIRDRLYRCSLGWNPVLAEWDSIGPTEIEPMWALVGRTYHFLAPRYMPVTEWQNMHAAMKSKTTRKNPVMTW